MRFFNRVLNYANHPHQDDSALKSVLTDTPRTTSILASSEASNFRRKSTRHDYSYAECVNGTAPVPHDPFGKSLFQLLMAGGMVTFMVSFNGILHYGPEFLVSSHWMYPLILCISLGMRFLFANRLVDYIAPRFILPHFQGFSRNVAMTILNVAIMAPVMGCIVTMLMNGPDGFLSHLAATLPLSAAVSLFVNLAIVGPAVKMAYHNLVLPLVGTRLFQVTQRYATNWAGIFTF